MAKNILTTANTPSDTALEAFLRNGLEADAQISPIQLAQLKQFATAQKRQTSHKAFWLLVASLTLFIAGGVILSNIPKMMRQPTLKPVLALLYEAESLTNAVSQLSVTIEADSLLAWQDVPYTEVATSLTEL